MLRVPVLVRKELFEPVYLQLGPCPGQSKVGAGQSGAAARQERNRLLIREALPERERVADKNCIDVALGPRPPKPFRRNAGPDIVVRSYLPEPNLGPQAALSIVDLNRGACGV